MALARIVIVGGGFGGVRAALDLEKKLRGHIATSIISSRRLSMRLHLSMD